VSHDLKNPLTSIRLNARLIHDTVPAGDASPVIRRRARSIERITDQMDRLVHGLLDLDAAEAGSLALHAEQINLRELVNETLAMLQPLALERSLRLLREDGGGPHVVHCDRERIRQVLSNLIGNAIKFSPDEGQILVRLRRTDGGLQLSVTDSGPGIPADQLPRIFDRGFRGDQLRVPGFGLGLAIARAIITAHGGRIWVESRAGQGSTFSFFLPR
jgi:signal transduction histidine kinase